MRQSRVILQDSADEHDTLFLHLAAYLFAYRFLHFARKVIASGITRREGIR
jgi:hypothetical protein